jgi:hypothetical protein
MPFIEEERVNKYPYGKRETIKWFFCIKCGQSFKKPKKHYLDIDNKIRCV